MSEYWVSNKKYFCKYCNIYIADDKPSRTQHESGLRHKGNVERFVRGLYKAGEKRKHDLEEEKREMAQVEKAAQAAFAQDVGAGLVKPGSSNAVASSSKQAGPSKPAPKPSDPYTNYTTAASLGYVDPDEERRKIEAERRAKEGVVGAWEVVEVVEEAKGEQGEGQASGSNQAEADIDAERKRQAEAPVDDDDIRPWKLRKKTVSTGLGEIYDPGLIPIKIKAKKEEPSSEAAGSSSALNVSSSGHSAGDNPSGSTVPKWTAKGWNRPGEGQGSSSTSVTASHTKAEPRASSETESRPASATEAASSAAKLEPSDEIPQAKEVKVEDRTLKAEETEASVAPPAQPLFKKRRGPAGTRSRR
ncbi:hypothetical protein BC629DRAFT_1538248 [Irpex lacteus]|nr:hypothetical protein BC629DRAFT_1538248 [Irpex lacteus]